MRKYLIPILLSARMFAADDLHPEHGAALPGYHVGDRVNVLDASGESYVATLLGHSNGVVRVAIDDAPYAFPAEHLTGKAGPVERLTTAWREGDPATWAWTALGAVVALIGPAALDAVEINGNGDDEPDVSESEAQARADAAAAASALAAIESGPTVSERYEISGTFTATEPQAGPTGAWYPSITFGPSGYGNRGGIIASATAPPATPGGPPQVLAGGEWVQVADGQISISGTLSTYVGRANVVQGSLFIRGVLLTGGVVVVKPGDAP